MTGSLPFNRSGQRDIKVCNKEYPVKAAVGRISFLVYSTSLLEKMVNTHPPPTPTTGAWDETLLRDVIK
jgi:hypothetical protein